MIIDINVRLKEETYKGWNGKGIKTRRWNGHEWKVA